MASINITNDNLLLKYNKGLIGYVFLIQYKDEYSYELECEIEKKIYKYEISNGKVESNCKTLIFDKNFISYADIWLIITLPKQIKQAKEVICNTYELYVFYPHTNSLALFVFKKVDENTYFQLLPTKRKLQYKNSSLLKGYDYKSKIRYEYKCLDVHIPAKWSSSFTIMGH